MNTIDRRKLLDIFYNIIDRLKRKLGGCRFLASCDGRMDWPERGVYFFFEQGEFREDNVTLRVVRVGTHALTKGSKTTLWDRLRQHRGTLSGSRPGGGDHRGSIFRLHIGSAILNKKEIKDRYPTWGVGSSAKADIKDKEYPIEKLVSQYIRKMPFIWLKIEDKPGPNSLRNYIEKNSIALLSNYGKSKINKIDPPSKNWLGYHSPNEKIRKSGLWNHKWVEKKPKKDFIQLLKSIFEKEY